MKNKIILDLCGGTGAWSKPYADAGYDVINITLPDYDILETEFRSYYDMIFNPRGLVLSGEDVYGILAAPPCTMFSLVRTTARKPRDFREGMELVVACLNIIWECRYRGKLGFWCLENPRGYLRQFLGKPVFTFQPYEFGHPYKKITDLWGHFNVPEKGPLVSPDKGSLAIRNEPFEQLPIDYVRPKGVRLDKIKRAITPSGFAKAFFKANK